MHASAFHVYGQLYEVISKGVARRGELPESLGVKHPRGLPESTTELIWAAQQSSTKI
jgi:hypothetical protein